MECTVTMELDGKSYGLHLDLDAFLALERAGWRGVVPLHDALRDMQVTAMQSTFVAAAAGWNRARAKSGEKKQPVPTAVEAGEICRRYGLTRARDVLLGALAAAASPETPDEPPADGDPDPPMPSPSA